MDGGVSFSRIGSVTAALVLFAAVPLASVATADKAVPRSTFAPIQTPAIETQSFALPYATPTFELARSIPASSAKSRSSLRSIDSISARQRFSSTLPTRRPSLLREQPT